MDASSPRSPPMASPPLNLAVPPQIPPHPRLHPNSGRPLLISRTNSHRSTRSVHSQRDHSIGPPTQDLDLPIHVHVHPQHRDVYVAGEDANEGWREAEQAELAGDQVFDEHLIASRQHSRAHSRHDSRPHSRSGVSREPHEEGHQIRKPHKTIQFVDRDRDRDRLQDHSREREGAQEPYRDEPHHRSTSGHSFVDAKNPKIQTSHYEDQGQATPDSDELADGGDDGDSDTDTDPTKDPAKWAQIREGSIARRSRWRRPGPQWLLPMIVAMAVSMGMGMAPKQELFINLACLAHPPRTATHAIDSFAYEPPTTVFALAKHIWNAPAVPETRWTTQSDNLQFPESIENVADLVPEPAIVTPDPILQAPLTPADKWMLDLQRRMAAEAARRHKLSAPTINGTAPPPHDRVPDGPVGRLPQGDGHSTPPPTTYPGIPDKEKPSAPPSSSPPSPDTEGARPGEIDPRVCKRDPKTQAAAAKLSMTMTLCMGILSAMTTGFWGATSDRLGRTRVLGIALCGFVINDLVLLLTATYPDKVPGGYRFLILGPVIDGCLGGVSTFQATNHAYMSDVTPDGSRAKVFSRLGGLMMAGFALGPLLGSAFIKFSDNILSVFYLAAAFNTFFVMYATFVLPESLSSEARAALAQMARNKSLKAKQRAQAEIDWERDDSAAYAGDSSWSRFTDVSVRRGKRLRGSVNRFRRRLFSFLSPLAMFVPKERRVPDNRGGFVMKKDYKLTLLVAAGFCASTLMGMLALKGQYLIYSYGWTSVELGPYMTLITGFRGLTLLIIFPLIVKYFRPKVKVDTTSSGENELDADLAVGVLRSPQTLADSKFDLKVLRISWMIDIIAYIAMSFLMPASVFIGVSVFISIGSAAGPAMNSLALNLLESQSEAGSLFGAMSVVQALSATFLGPLIFSNIFAVTVGWYAPSIFAASAITLAIALTILGFIQLPKEYPKPDVERGRTRQVKRVKSSSGVQRGAEGERSSSSSSG